VNYVGEFLNKEPKLTISPSPRPGYDLRYELSTERIRALGWSEKKPIKEQIVHLYAAKMPVSDADVSWISKLPNLKRLNVNYSNMDDPDEEDEIPMTTKEKIETLRAIRLKNIEGSVIDSED
jgi:hypothetical protein